MSKTAARPFRVRNGQSSSAPARTRKSADRERAPRGTKIAPLPKPSGRAGSSRSVHSHADSRVPSRKPDSRNTSSADADADTSAKTAKTAKTARSDLKSSAKPGLKTD